MKLKSEDSV